MDYKQTSSVDVQKIDTQASKVPLIQTTSHYNVTQEIEKLSRQINELLEKIPKDDPEYKSNAKKLYEIKKLLERKTDFSGNFMEKLLPRKKKVIVSAKDGTYGEVEIETSPSEFFGEQIPAPQDLINMNVDDSILHLVDVIISAYKAVGNLFKK